VQLSAHVFSSKHTRRERRRDTHEWWDVLEAVDLPAIIRQADLVLQHERNLDDTRDARRHECVPKHLVRHRTDHQVLWMRAHRPSRHENHESRNEVPLRLAIPTS
jgi:hypothetical protein